MTTIRGVHIRKAAEESAYNYLMMNAPEYAIAIEQELAQGATALEVQSMVAQEVGPSPDAQHFARMCGQAARYLGRRNG